MQNQYSLVLFSHLKCICNLQILTFDSKCAVCTAQIRVKSSMFSQKNWAEATCQLGDLHSRRLRFAAIARRVFGWCFPNKILVLQFYKQRNGSLHFFPAYKQILHDFTSKHGDMWIFFFFCKHNWWPYEISFANQ